MPTKENPRFRGCHDATRICQKSESVGMRRNPSDGSVVRVAGCIEFGTTNYASRGVNNASPFALLS
jgi:hypothetical protein